MNSNAIKADVPFAPRAPKAAKPRTSSRLLDESAATWLTATAALASLYFCSICVGYLIFAGVLPEMRLAFVFGAVFLAMGVTRAIALWRGAYPTRNSAMVYGLYAAIVVIQFLWFVPIANAGGIEHYSTLIGDTIVVSGILAMTGEALGTLWLHGRMRTVFWAVVIPFAVCLGTIVLGIGMGWDATAEMRLMFQTVTTSGDVYNYNYLALGDAVAVLGLLTLALVRTLPRRLVVFVLTAGGLFFAYSRTSFFLYLVCSTLVFLIGANDSQKIGLATAIFFLGVIGIGVFGDSEILKPAMERMAVLVTDRNQDDSYMARRELFHENLLHLKENWFLGRFMDQWWRYGDNSGYIHNWLSFWQSYGIVPFCASLMIFGILAGSLWQELLNPRVTSGAAMAIFSYGMIAISTSRSYTSPYIWLVLSVVASLVIRVSRPIETK